MGFTSYVVIFNEVYIKSQLNIILLSQPLGDTRCCSKSTWLYLKSPYSLWHNDPTLGGYTGWSFYEHKAISSPRLLQAWQPGTWGLHIWSIQFFASDWDEQHGFLQSGSNYLETSLKSSLCSVQDLGATGNMDIREKYLPIFSMTRHHQSWTDVGNNQEPALETIMTRNYQFW